VAGDLPGPAAGYLESYVEGLERRARSQLPLEVYNFYAGGSGREITLRANLSAWARVPLMPRVLRDVSAVDTAVRVLSSDLPTPVAVAPTGFHRLAHPGGEVETATGATRAGALFVLSTRSSCRIEDVAAASAGPWWYQVYVMRDRSLTAGLVRRAATAGAQALVLTADTPEPGRKVRTSGELISDAEFLVNLRPDVDTALADQGRDVTYAHIGWLSELSGGLPILVKGVLRPDDAVACVAHGAAGVIVSNHGGRQLNGAGVPGVASLDGVAGAPSPDPAPGRA
jgi:4-hydroxymandelate oxidase